VDIRAGGRHPEGVDHVRRGPDLGIAAPEVDHRPAAVGVHRGHPVEQRGEVLLR
jgi:hypothetical protein